MAKTLSIASWNVEHFKQDHGRVGRVIDFLAGSNPDVFALFEVEGSTVFQDLVARMPGYTFQITEGPQTQEILVGVRKNVTAFITQKTEYRSGTTHMRPGQLVTVHAAGRNYSILFLHVASGVNPRGMGLRDDMIERALDFRKALSKQDRKNGGDGEVSYMFIGDLNSMGLKYPFDRDITSDLELRNWDAKARKSRQNKMRRLRKTHEHSWSNGSGSPIPDSNLDHVYATDKVKFRSFRRGDEEAEVKVTGWTDFSDPADKDAWIRDFSDHAMLYLEIHD